MQIFYKAPELISHHQSGTRRYILYDKWPNTKHVLSKCFRIKFLCFEACSFTNQKIVLELIILKNMCLFMTSRITNTYLGELFVNALNIRMHWQTLKVQSLSTRPHVKSHDEHLCVTTSILISKNIQLYIRESEINAIFWTMNTPTNLDRSNALDLQQ